MFLEYDEKEIKKIQEITNTDYEYKNGLIPYDSAISIIEDLVCAWDTLNKKYEDLQKDLEDNYRPIPLDDIDMYG